MANVESVVNWFRAREGKVTYSMVYRNGPNSYDCSSSVFYALIEAGFLPKGTRIGNTETLYGLEGTVLQRISRSEVKRGDIFISGGKGTSAGANGHTGVFVSNSRIIHCNYGKNGIAETAASGGWMGGPPNDYFRLKNAESTEKKTKKRGEAMILFRPINDPTVYWLVGNKFVSIKSEEHLKLIQLMMSQAGYDTHVHTNLDQIAYIRKIAQEVK